MSMNKLSSDKAASAIRQGAAVISAQSEKIAAQVAENQGLREKLAYYERRDRAEKIAKKMELKQLDQDTSYEEKLANLMDEGTDLDVVEQAIEYSAPQQKLAAVSDHPGNPSDAQTAFEQAILGD